jgi:hypothetical protein
MTAITDARRAHLQWILDYAADGLQPDPNCPVCKKAGATCDECEVPEEVTDTLDEAWEQVGKAETEEDAERIYLAAFARAAGITWPEKVTPAEREFAEAGTYAAPGAAAGGIRK